jgi:3-hydroxyacyl-[acyl-carrier-protein] dehydratase
MGLFSKSKPIYILFIPLSAQYPIMKYIPQAPPFEMIDRLVEASETLTQTELHIREGHLFVENGVFTEPGLIENMAQTAAAGTGFKAAQEGLPAPVGFIGAIKDLKINICPPVGATISTIVKPITQIMQVHVIHAQVQWKEQTIAEAEFKIFLQ